MKALWKALVEAKMKTDEDFVVFVLQQNDMLNRGPKALLGAVSIIVGLKSMAVNRLRGSDTECFK
jgi:hypothetical protein